MRLGVSVADHPCFLDRDEPGGHHLVEDGDEALDVLLRVDDLDDC
jgi:hypothetical protein